MMVQPVLTPYDEIVYPDGLFAQSHPDRLAMLGTLMGMTPPPVPTARVLELGCAQGGNLIPMAYQFPQATFVGIDYASTQIDIARDHARALGLTNIRFDALNFMDVDDGALGEFDYILAHGIYSWVPADVQRRMLAIYKTHLAPQGVSYISYNTLPGWRLYGVGREAMMFRTRHVTDPQERLRLARAYLNGIASVERQLDSDNSWTHFQRAYDLLLKSQNDYIRTKPDNFLVHDELEPNNEALYFTEFMERAEGAGLQFLCESYFPISLASNMASGVQEFLAEHCSTLMELEQTLDFLRNRTFRQTLLVHDDVPLERHITLDRLARIYVTSPLQIETLESDSDLPLVRFTSTDDEHTFEGRDPFTVECFRLLSENFPREFTVAELVTRAREKLYPYQVPPRSFDEHARDIASNLIQGFGRSYLMVEFRSTPAPFLNAVSERPLASALARYRAISDFRVPNQRQEEVNLDPSARLILSHCDGQHDLAGLVQVMRQQAVVPADGDMTAGLEAIEKEVTQILRYLRRSALLVG